MKSLKKLFFNLIWEKPISWLMFIFLINLYSKSIDQPQLSKVSKEHCPCNNPSILRIITKEGKLHSSPTMVRYRPRSSLTKKRCILSLFASTHPESITVFKHALLECEQSTHSPTLRQGLSYLLWCFSLCLK